MFSFQPYYPALVYICIHLISANEQIHVWVAVLLTSMFLSFAVVVRMLRYRVDDRWEDVQHEDHGCHQAWHETDCRRTGSPLTQKPRTERRPGGGV